MKIKLHPAIVFSLAVLLARPASADEFQVRPVEDDEFQVRPVEDDEFQVRPVEDDEFQVRFVEEDEFPELQRSPVNDIFNADPDIVSPLWVEDMRNEALSQFDFSPVGSMMREEGDAVAELALLPAAPPPARRALSLKKPPPAGDRQTSGSLLTCGSRRVPAGYYWVRSPNYPDVYPNGQLCDYRIYPPSGGAVSFECYKFRLENSTGCTKDYLQVFSRRYCGSAVPPPLSDYTYMRLHFRTDCDREEGGFNCVVQARQQGYGSGGMRCGYYYSLAAGTYTIRSENYPDDYNNLRHCRWYLRAATTSHRLTISCERFHLEEDSDCEFDYLNVNGRRYCGTTAPSLTSRSYYLYLIFSSDYSVRRPGFSCTIRVGPPSACSCGIKNAGRIVNGEDAASGEWPWMAGIVYTGGTRTFCGGSLINNLYVLTAAHCVSSRTVNNTEVLLGDHRIGVADGETRHSLSRISIHPNYTGSAVVGWDIALLRLSSPVTFTTRRRPVCLPTAGTTYAGVVAIATGFGRTNNSEPQATVLQEAPLTVVSEATCRQRWSFINTSHLCAGGGTDGRAICFGDSGGPLVAYENGHYVVVGASSFVSSISCFVTGYYNGFARVSSALSWIRQNTTDATYCS